MTAPQPARRQRLFQHGCLFLESSRAPPTILRALRRPAVALIASAAIALVWANNPVVGLLPRPGCAGRRAEAAPPSASTPGRPTGCWRSSSSCRARAKREFVAGDLRDPAPCRPPVVGRRRDARPAIVYALWNLGSNGELNGWAIPTATDIAFAVARSSP